MQRRWPALENRRRQSEERVSRGTHVAAHLRRLTISKGPEAEVTSIKLSIPKPTSEILPAIRPAAVAMRPSAAFHAIVKYSSLFPRCTTAGRSNSKVSPMFAVYQSVSKNNAATPEVLWIEVILQFISAYD